MMEQIKKINLSHPYKEGLLEYKECLDMFPNLIEFVSNGYSIENYKKIEKLYFIESLKYDIRDTENASQEEIEELENTIEELIAEYNNM